MFAKNLPLSEDSMHESCKSLMDVVDDEQAKILLFFMFSKSFSPKCVTDS